MKRRVSVERRIGIWSRARASIGAGQVSVFLGQVNICVLGETVRDSQQFTEESMMIIRTSSSLVPTFVCCLALLLSACGGGGSGDGNVDDAGSSSSSGGGGSIGGGSTALAARYDGDWLGPCEDDGDGEFSREQLSFADGSVTGVSRLYLDADCQTRLPDDTDFRTHMTLHFPGGSVATSLGAADPVDVQLTWIEVDGERYTVSDLSAMEALGLSWLFEDLGETDYDIMIVSGDRLYFGDIDADPALDGSSASARPRVLDLTYSMARVR